MGHLARSLVALTLLIAAACGKSDRPATPTGVTGDLESIQGTWSVVRYEMDGEPLPIKDDQMVFAGEKCSLIEEKGKHQVEESFKLGPAAKPKTIDLTSTSKVTEFQPIGQEKTPPKVLKTETEISEGIYTLEGDTLTICFAASRKAFFPPDRKITNFERPKDFSSKDGHTLIVLKRAK